MRILYASALLLTTTMLLAGAGAHYTPAGNPACQPADGIHVYLSLGGAGAETSMASPNLGVVMAGDGHMGVAPCNGSTQPFAFDGDSEYGVGGAAFPNGPNATACGYASSHHDSTFTVTDHAGATVAFMVGADNTQIAPAVDPCLTDGIIDQTLDPNDCQAPLAVTPAIAGVPSSGTCVGGVDGLTWVFLATGVVQTPVGVVLSTPTTGDIY